MRKAHVDLLFENTIEKCCVNIKVMKMKVESDCKAHKTWIEVSFTTGAKVSLKSI